MRVKLHMKNHTTRRVRIHIEPKVEEVARMIITVDIIKKDNTMETIIKKFMDNKSHHIEAAEEVEEAVVAIELTEVVIMKITTKSKLMRESINLRGNTELRELKKKVLILRKESIKRIHTKEAEVPKAEEDPEEVTKKLQVDINSPNM